MVLKEVGVTTIEEGKLRSQSEEPYVVTASNYLKDAEERELPHPWNA